MASVKSPVQSFQSTKLKHSQTATKPGTGHCAPVESLESVVLTALKAAPLRRAKAKLQDQIHERTVRMRRQGEPDRRFFVAYATDPDDRSEEHTSELQSLMRNSYAVFCLKK